MGIWDDNSFDFAALTGLPLAMDKTDALDYGLAAMNHAMVLTGVNLDEAGKPTVGRLKTAGATRTAKGLLCLLGQLVRPVCLPGRR